LGFGRWLSAQKTRRKGSASRLLRIHRRYMKGTVLVFVVVILIIIFLLLLLTGQEEIVVVVVGRW
jgi:hypothetical protein